MFPIKTFLLCVVATSAEATGYGVYKSNLAADPVAVPSSAGSKSTGSAEFVVGSILPDGGIEITISWELVGDDVLSEDNALIGMHVHAGNSSENGPIVWGFCGQDPLPPFRGPCPQDNTATSVWYAGEVCDFAGPCLNDGNSSDALDTAALLSGAPMYVNIHTTKSFAANGDNPLGLIRGQLVSLGSSSGNLVHTGMTTLLVAVAALATI